MDRGIGGSDSHPHHSPSRDARITSRQRGHSLRQRTTRACRSAFVHCAVQCAAVRAGADVSGLVAVALGGWYANGGRCGFDTVNVDAEGLRRLVDGRDVFPLVQREAVVPKRETLEDLFVLRALSPVFRRARTAGLGG